MAVSFNTKFYKGSGSQASPFAYVSSAGTVAGTIAANANRVLIAAAGFRGITPSAVAVTWNSVSMTQIGTQLSFGSNFLDIFGLIAPASGAQTISCSWTGGTAAPIVLSAACFDGADQVTGWIDRSSVTGTSTSSTGAVTTTSGNAVFACHGDNNASSLTISVGTEIFKDTGFNGNWGSAYKLSGSASETFTWTLGSSVAWEQLRADIIAFGAAAGPIGKLIFARQAVNRAATY